MPKVDIRHEDRYETVTAIAVFGPWAITPSRRPETPGLVVTHVPSGTQAWPNRACAPILLPEAIAMAKKLQSVWNSDSNMPDTIRLQIKGMVCA